MVDYLQHKEYYIKHLKVKEQMKLKEVKYLI